MNHTPHEAEIDENPYSLWRFVKFPKIEFVHADFKPNLTKVGLYYHVATHDVMDVPNCTKMADYIQGSYVDKVFNRRTALKCPVNCVGLSQVARMDLIERGINVVMCYNGMDSITSGVLSDGKSLHDALMINMVVLYIEKVCDDIKGEFLDAKVMQFISSKLHSLENEVRWSSTLPQISHDVSFARHERKSGETEWDKRKCDITTSVEFADAFRIKCSIGGTTYEMILRINNGNLELNLDNAVVELLNDVYEIWGFENG